MRRLVIVTCFLLSVGVAYYAGAQQAGHPAYADLRTAWESVQGKAGEFAAYDHPLLAFKIREDGDWTVTSVGADHVVLRVKGSSLTKIVPLTQITLNLDVTK